jgi:hypothetical protein
VNFKSAAQIRVFYQLYHIRQSLNELILDTAKLLELNHVHSLEIIDIHFGLPNAVLPVVLRPDPQCKRETEPPVPRHCREEIGKPLNQLRRSQ